MRETRLMVHHHTGQTPLVVRAGLPRTFWSLGLFAEASLLFCGLYLLGQQITQPLKADQTAVIGAGLILALAIVLLVYLVRPWRRAALAKKEPSRRLAMLETDQLTVFGETVRNRREAERALVETDNLPGPM